MIARHPHNRRFYPEKLTARTPSADNCGAALVLIAGLRSGGGGMGRGRWVWGAAQLASSEFGTAKMVGALSRFGCCLCGSVGTDGAPLVLDCRGGNNIRKI